MASPIKFRAEVTGIERHDEGVATFEFRYLGRRPRYKPGQFLHLALDSYDNSSHWPESRAFTIAKGASDPRFLRLTIAQKGEFTSRIFKELVVGEQVWMKAPYGEFIVNCEPDNEVALIAGGTGVSPFVAFMEDALVEGIEGEVWLHYGARDAGLLAYRYLADQCAEALPGFHVRYYVESGDNENTSVGRIDLKNVCGALRHVGNATFYLCGPREMTQALSAQLSDDYRVSKAKIRVDDWN